MITAPASAPADGPAGCAWFDGPGGQRLQLWPHKAAFDPDLRLLLVADVHLGKAHAFRRAGVPVPSGTTAEAFSRLDALITATGATRLAVLGDLLHAARGRGEGTLAAAIAWRQRQAALDLLLVRGNHDRHAGDPPPELGVQVVEAPHAPAWLGAWALQHEPHPVSGRYALAGHVHPGVVLAGPARQRLRLPCFHFGPGCGVLPAFGGFTGLHAVPRAPGDAVYAVLPPGPAAVAGAAHVGAQAGAVVRLATLPG